MPVVRLSAALSTGSVALIGVLAALAATTGLGVVAWSVGLACGGLVVATLARAQPRVPALGPADVVTLARTFLTCAIAALVAEASLDDRSLGPLVALSVVSLLLDAVDGPVARHTRTASPFGARFDGESDAFLLLVLSVYVAGVLGWWVLAIGAARYVFGLAALGLPWMGRPLPFRYWRKVVTAVQGIALVVAATEVMPRAASYAAVGGALVLLAESFGRDVLWLWRRRREEPARDRTATGRTAGSQLRVP